MTKKHITLLVVTLAGFLTLLGAARIHREGLGESEGEDFDHQAQQVQSAEVSGEEVVEPAKSNPLDDLKIYKEKRLDDQIRLVVLDHELSAAVGVAVLDADGTFKYWLEEGKIDAGNVEGGRVKSPGEYLDWWKVEDINNDGTIEVAIQYVISGTGLVHPFYLYQKRGESFELVLKLIEGVSQVKIVDLNNDGIKEIYHSYALDTGGVGPRSWTVWRDVWVWQNGRYQKLNHFFPSIYENLIHYYDYLLGSPDPDQWLTSYYPMLRCLKESAQSNAQEIFSDGSRCTRR